MKLAAYLVSMLAMFAVSYRVGEIAQLPSPGILAFVSTACGVGMGICVFLLCKPDNLKRVA